MHTVLIHRFWSIITVKNIINDWQRHGESDWCIVSRVLSQASELTESYLEPTWIHSLDVLCAPDADAAYTELQHTQLHTYLATAVLQKSGKKTQEKIFNIRLKHNKIYPLCDHH